MLKNLILKGVKVLTRLSVKLIKYTFKQLKYLVVGFIFATALLLDINYNFMKKLFIAKSECMQEFIIYIMLALSIYAINDLMPKKEISNLSTKLEKVVIKANALKSDKANKVVNNDSKVIEKTADKKEEKEEIKEEEIEIIEVEDVEKVDATFNGCDMDYTTCKIKEVATSYNIDWRLPVAIARHECGFKNGEYLSNAFKEKNNVGGLMYWDATSKKSKLMTFDTIDAGIEAFVSNLKRNYFDLGLDTISEIQPKYAPINAQNDPYGLNNVWQIGVKAYLSQLY